MGEVANVVMEFEEGGEIFRDDVEVYYCIKAESSKKKLKIYEAVQKYL